MILGVGDAKVRNPLYEGSVISCFTSHSKTVHSYGYFTTVAWHLKKSCEGYWSCQRLPSHVVSEFKVMFEKLRSDATPGSKIGPRTPYPPYTKRASYLPEYRERDWDKHSSLNLNALVLFSLNCLYSHVCWNGLF